MLKRHWQALAKLYAAFPREAHMELVGDDTLSWMTFLQLSQYKPSLVCDMRAKHQFSADLTARLTAAGLAYYEANFERYRQIYPDVEAQPPEECTLEFYPVPTRYASEYSAYRVAEMP